MFVDADSLKALMIYFIIKAKCAKLLVDVICIEEFTPESVKFTNRAYYMTVFHSAFEYLEELSENKLAELQEIIETRINNKFAAELSDDEIEEEVIEKLAVTERRKTAKPVPISQNYTLLLVDDYFQEPRNKKSSVTSSFAEGSGSGLKKSGRLLSSLTKSFNVIGDYHADSLQINIEIYKSSDNPEDSKSNFYTSKDDFYKFQRVKKSTEIDNRKLLKPNLFKTNAFDEGSHLEMLKEISESQSSSSCKSFHLSFIILLHY